MEVLTNIQMMEIFNLLEKHQFKTIFNKYSYSKFRQFLRGQYTDYNNYEKYLDEISDDGFHTRRESGNYLSSDEYFKMVKNNWNETLKSFNFEILQVKKLYNQKKKLKIKTSDKEIINDEILKLNKKLLYFKIKPINKYKKLQEITILKINDLEINKLINKDSKKNNELYLFNLIEEAITKNSNYITLDKKLFEKEPDNSIGWYLQKINDYLKKYLPEIDIKEQYCTFKPNLKRKIINGIYLEIEKT